MEMEGERHSVERADARSPVGRERLWKRAAKRRVRHAERRAADTLDAMARERGETDHGSSDETHRFPLSGARPETLPRAARSLTKEPYLLAYQGHNDLDWKIVKQGMEKLMADRSNPPTLGAVMRGIRSRNGWTLKEMSAKSGTPFANPVPSARRYPFSADDLHGKKLNSCLAPPRRRPP